MCCGWAEITPVTPLFTFWHWQKAVLILLVNLLQMGKIISMAFSHWIDSSFFRNLSSHLCTYPSWYYSFHDQGISDETYSPFSNWSASLTAFWGRTWFWFGFGGWFFWSCLPYINSTKLSWDQTMYSFSLSTSGHNLHFVSSCLLYSPFQKRNLIPSVGNLFRSFPDDATPVCVICKLHYHISWAGSPMKML